MRYLVAIFLLWAGAAVAQPACSPTAPGAIACLSPAVTLQLSDIVWAQQAAGPLRSNQTVSMSLQQILTKYLNTSNTWVSPQTFSGAITAPSYVATGPFSTNSRITQAAGGSFNLTAVPTCSQEWWCNFVYASGTVAGTSNVNQILVQDNVSSTGNIYGLNFTYNVAPNATSSTGPRVGMAVSLVQVGTGGGGTITTPGISTGMVVNAWGQSNDGGTAPTPVGALNGMNVTCVLYSGATYLTGCSGQEIDVAFNSGSSARDKIGLLITQLSGDAVSGTRDDVAVAITNQALPGAGTTGWKYGLEFGSLGGSWPIISTGTLIGANTASGSMTAATGIDFSGVTFSGYSLNLPNFTATGSGNVMVGGSIKVNGATGVTSTGDVNITGAFKVNGVALAAAPLSATSASIGGGALLAGACATTATTVTGATVGMAVVSTPNTYPGAGNLWSSYVSGVNTVTTEICAVVAATPTASTYNIRVLQ